MKKKKSQKDAVYEIVRKVLGDLYSPNEKMRRHFCNGKGHQHYKSSPGSIPRMDKAVELFLNQIEVGNIEMPRLSDYEWENHDPKVKLETYARRIIFNWLNKDHRLNGSKEYELNKTIISKDKVLNEIHSLIFKIKTKEVWTGWGRSRRLTLKLKEKHEITPEEHETLAQLNEMYSSREKTLIGYGKYLPQIFNCIDMKSTDNLISSIRNAEYDGELELLVEEFIFHILQSTDPMSPKEDVIMKKKAS